jgi:hypothetical protein
MKTEKLIEAMRDAVKRGSGKDLVIIDSLADPQVRLLPADPPPSFWEHRPFKLSPPPPCEGQGCVICDALVSPEREIIRECLARLFPMASSRPPVHECFQLVSRMRQATERMDGLARRAIR